MSTISLIIEIFSIWKKFTQSFFHSIIYNAVPPVVLKGKRNLRGETRENELPIHSISKLGFFLKKLHHCTKIVKPISNAKSTEKVKTVKTSGIMASQK